MKAYADYWIWKESFPSKESNAKVLQSIYFAHKVGIISFAKCLW